MIKKVNICGIQYDVEYKADNFNFDSHFGMIDYTQAKILINESMPDEVVKQTLCHEIIHGILVAIGRNDLNDETFVQSLASAINISFDIKGCDK